ncbi:NAD-dependent epimerase/dehydratase family protein [Arthrobacter sp. ISL-69]|uniref:NAD-dependent epimerase/dehydratase family protein n=1 Tax=Arthrobacter sp. ISL-69 TaxID=2819113 RepID=UPI001BEC852B|nr:NAD-dependent epimerase/dehydratase family protein [Arthrobacter sp. ISL-69]MBT2537369.1 NAD-dependent epimerase/dehydratase family protein [Arthrobacter sp. ISL-69]
MRIAIVGATGNAGTALLRRLHEQQAQRPDTLELVGISRRLPDQSAAPYGGVEWHAVDITDDDGGRLRAALAGVDAVVHLAWILQPNHDMAALHRTNVTGTANVLRAAREAGVGHVVCASSVGAYSSSAKEPRRTEDWPATGIPESHYSRHKAEQEALLDRFEAENPATAVARLRTALIFQGAAGSEIGRYFLGPLIPRLLPGHIRLPLLPIPAELVFQAIHADDAADAYWRILDRRATGAFNVAAEPVITPVELARLLHARRWLPIPLWLLRMAVDLSWRLRLQPTDAGWIAMAEGAPIMDTGRAREVLGWEPRASSLDAIREVLEGLGMGRGTAGSPPLKPRNRPGMDLADR